MSPLLYRCPLVCTSRSSDVMSAEKPPLACVGWWVGVLVGWWVGVSRGIMVRWYDGEGWCGIGWMVLFFAGTSDNPGQVGILGREANHRDFILNNLLWHQCTDWWNFQVFFAKTIWGKAQGSRIFADGSKDPKGTLGRRENIAKRSQTCYFSFSPNKSKLCGNQWSPLTASVRG